MIKHSSLTLTIGITAAALFLNNGTANAISFIGYDANTSTLPTPLPLPFDPNSNSQIAFNNFSANLSSATVTTESFETTPVGTLIDNLSTVISGINVKFSYKKIDGTSASSATSPSTQVQQADSIGLTNSGTYPTNGLRGISINSTNNFSISFTDTAGNPSLIAAFGYFGTDLGDFKNGLTMQFFNGTTLVNPLEQAIALPNTSSNSSEFFYGFIADSSAQEFDRVAFVNSKSNDAIGIDQIKIATPAQRLSTQAPEPATIIGTLIGAGYIRRIKRRQQLDKLSNK
jgi:hypothetical protein